MFTEGSVVLFKSDESKKNYWFLHLITKIKVEETNEKDKLSIKQTVAKFNDWKHSVWNLVEKVWVKRIWNCLGKVYVNCINCLCWLVIGFTHRILQVFTYYPIVLFKNVLSRSITAQWTIIYYQNIRKMYSK